MMSSPNYNFDAIEDEYVFRLCEEHIKLDSLSQTNENVLSYKVVKNSRQYPHPPIEYHITYCLESIVAVDDEEYPIFDKEHILEIILPPTFPEQPADCKMLTNVWHPNIKYSGPFKGAICTNHEGFGTLFGLDELTIRIGEFLQYKRYWAKDIPPYPEDPEVAEWVRDFAEPRGLINPKKEIWTNGHHWKLEEEIDIHEKNNKNNNSDDDSDSSEDLDDFSDISFT